MKAIKTNPKGFSLVELLVAMAAGLVVMAGIYTAYINYQRSHVTQQLVVDMQQNSRAAMTLMKREIRMAGYAPAATDGVNNDGLGNADDGAELTSFGLIKAEYDAGSGISFIRFTADLNYNWTVDADEDISYTLVDTQLQRKGEIVAYDIEAVGLAYAFDDDPDDDEMILYVSDGTLVPGNNENIIWAVDSDGNDELDAYLDTNDDGVIDENDTQGGANMAGQVPIAQIRAVRIWLLARTRQPIPGHFDNQTYAVGAVHKGPADADWDPRRKRVLLTTTVYCRNMGI